MDSGIPVGTKKIYRFGCRDVGANCDFVATGDSVEEVKDKWFAHAYVAHAEIMQGMNEAKIAQLADRVETIIRDRAQPLHAGTST